MTVLAAITDSRAELYDLAVLVDSRKASLDVALDSIVPLLIPAVLPITEARRLFVLLVGAVGEARVCRRDPLEYAEAAALPVRLAGRVRMGLDANVGILLDELAAS